MHTYGSNRIKKREKREKKRVTTPTPNFVPFVHGAKKVFTQRTPEKKMNSQQQLCFLDTPSPTELSTISELQDMSAEISEFY